MRQVIGHYLIVGEAFIEEQMEAPVLLVSTGPKREETILRREHPGFEVLMAGRL